MAANATKIADKHKEVHDKTMGNKGSSERRCYTIIS